MPKTLDWYCTIRMQELGIPRGQKRRPYFDRTGKWRAFEWRERGGGNITSGVYVNSGVVNPDLLKGEKGGRLWLKARLRDRIDAIITHEWEESKTTDHVSALKAAPETDLPITDGARRILRSMATGSRSRTVASFLPVSVSV